MEDKKQGIVLQKWCAMLSIFALFPLSQSFHYGEALSKSLLYFESQRSGRLPYNQRVIWRDHSGLNDGLEQGVSPLIHFTIYPIYIYNKIIRQWLINCLCSISQVDLVGGYYDAGDNVKFGLPMAFTITMLSWGVIEYGKEIVDSGEYNHALEAIKWGTDYFIKAHTHPNVLWVEVIHCRKV